MQITWHKMTPMPLLKQLDYANQKQNLEANEEKERVAMLERLDSNTLEDQNFKF